MNRYFEFSRRQLYFLAFLSFSAVALGSYALLDRVMTSEAATPRLPVHAGAAVDPASPPLVSAAGGLTVGSFVLDPNTAPADSLELLPGIGPAKAATMITARDTLPFATEDDLLRVEGIGPKTLEKMRPFIKITIPQADAQ